MASEAPSRFCYSFGISLRDNTTDPTKTVAASVLAAIALFACAPIEVRPLPAVEPNNSATVTIYRKWKSFNGGADFVVKLNKQPIAALPNGRHVSFRIPAGLHMVELHRAVPPASAMVQASSGDRFCYWYAAAGFAGPTDNDLIPVHCDELGGMIADKKGHVVN